MALYNEEEFQKEMFSGLEATTEEEQKTKAEMPSLPKSPERPTITEESALADIRSRYGAEAPRPPVEKAGLTTGLQHGFRRGLATIPDTLDWLSGLVARATGTEKGGAFAKLAQAIKPEDLDTDAETLSYKIGNAVGMGVEQAAELGLFFIKPLQAAGWGTRAAKMAEGGVQLGKAAELAKVGEAGVKATKLGAAAKLKDIPSLFTTAGREAVVAREALKEAPKSVGLIGKIGESSLAPSVGLAAAGALEGAKAGEREGGFVEAVKQGLKGGTAGFGMGTVLGVSQALKFYKRVLAGGAIFSGMGMLEGERDWQKIAADGVTGMILSLGGGEKHRNAEQSVRGVPMGTDGEPAIPKAPTHAEVWRNFFDGMKDTGTKTDAKWFKQIPSMARQQSFKTYIDPYVGLVGEIEPYKAIFEHPFRGDPVAFKEYIISVEKVMGLTDHAANMYRDNFLWEVTGGKVGKPYIRPPLDEMPKKPTPKVGKGPHEYVKVSKEEGKIPATPRESEMTKAMEMVGFNYPDAKKHMSQDLGWWILNNELTSKDIEITKDGIITPLSKKGANVIEAARAAGVQFTTGKYPPLEGEVTEEVVPKPGKEVTPKKVKAAEEVTPEVRAKVTPKIKPTPEEEAIVDRLIAEKKAMPYEREKLLKQLTEPRPTDNLKPAIKDKGKVIAGEEGENHPAILEKNKIKETKATKRGFVTPKGEFLDRKVAREYVKKNQPDVENALSKKLKAGEELHSEDYNDAIKVLEPIVKEAKRGAIRADDIVETEELPKTDPREHVAGNVIKNFMTEILGTDQEIKATIKSESALQGIKLTNSEVNKIASWIKDQNIAKEANREYKRLRDVEAARREEGLAPKKPAKGDRRRVLREEFGPRELWGTDLDNRAQEARSKLLSGRSIEEPERVILGIKTLKTLLDKYNIKVENVDERRKLAQGIKRIRKEQSKLADRTDLAEEEKQIELEKLAGKLHDKLNEHKALGGELTPAEERILPYSRMELNKIGNAILALDRLERELNRFMKQEVITKIPVGESKFMGMIETSKISDPSYYYIQPEGMPSLTQQRIGAGPAGVRMPPSFNPLAGMVGSLKGTPDELRLVRKGEVGATHIPTGTKKPGARVGGYRQVRVDMKRADPKTFDINLYGTELKGEDRIAVSKELIRINNRLGKIVDKTPLAKGKITTEVVNNWMTRASQIKNVLEADRVQNKLGARDVRKLTTELDNLERKLGGRDEEALLRRRKLELTAMMKAKLPKELRQEKAELMEARLRITEDYKNRIKIAKTKSERAALTKKLEEYQARTTQKLTEGTFLKIGDGKLKLETTPEGKKIWKFYWPADFWSEEYPKATLARSTELLVSQNLKNAGILDVEKAFDYKSVRTSPDVGQLIKLPPIPKAEREPSGVKIPEWKTAISYATTGIWDEPGWESRQDIGPEGLVRVTGRAVTFRAKPGLEPLPEEHPEVKGKTALQKELDKSAKMVDSYIGELSPDEQESFKTLRRQMSGAPSPEQVGIMQRGGKSPLELQRASMNVLERELTNIAILQEDIQTAMSTGEETPKIDSLNRELRAGVERLKNYIEAAGQERPGTGQDAVNVATGLVDKFTENWVKHTPEGAPPHWMGGITDKYGFLRRYPVDPSTEGLFTKGSRAVMDLTRNLYRAIAGRTGSLQMATKETRARMARDIVDTGMENLDPATRRYLTTLDPMAPEFLDLPDLVFHMLGGDPKQYKNPDVAAAATIRMKLNGEFRIILKDLRAQADKVYQLADLARGKIPGGKDPLAYMDQVLKGTKDRPRGTPTDIPEINAAMEAHYEFMDMIANSPRFKDELTQSYIHKYYPLIQSFDQAYEQFRSRIDKATSPEKLPGYLQHLGDHERESLLATVAKKPFWDNPNEPGRSLTTVEREIVKKYMFESTGFYPDRQSAPYDLTERIGSKTYNPHLIQRRGSAYHTENDYKSVMEQYIYRMAKYAKDTELKKQIMPMINKYDSRLSRMPTSTRHVLEEITRQGLRTPTRQDLFMRNIINNFNDMALRVFGKELPAAMQNPANISNTIVGRVAQGALGYPTAIKKLWQLTNAWADLGSNDLGKGIKAYLRGERAPEGLWDFLGISHMAMEGVEARSLKTLKTKIAGRGPIGKALAVYDYIGRMALDPIQWSTNFKNEVTFLSAMNRAAREGYSFERGISMSLKDVMLNPDHSNLHISEAAWKSGMDTIRLMYGWTGEHRTPMHRGPIARMGTIFWQYPVKTFQTIYGGFTDAVAQGDAAKFGRYGLLLGFQLSFVSALAALGLNAKSIFTQGGVVPISGFPVVWDIMKGSYNAIAGRPAEKSKAWDDFLNAVGTIAVPQYQVGRRIKRSIEAVNEGFWKAGYKELPTQEASPFSVIMNVLGYGPKGSVEAWELVQQMSEEKILMGKDSANYKMKAVKALEDGHPEKIPEVLNEAMNKGVPLTSKSIYDLYRTRKEKTYLEDALRRAPKHMRRYFQERIRTLEEKYMPETTKKQEERGFWSKE